MLYISTTEIPISIPLTRLIIYGNELTGDIPRSELMAKVTPIDIKAKPRIYIPTLVQKFLSILITYFFIGIEFWH